MPHADAFDAVVVGAGPNGLAAAITLAQHSRSVLVLEAEDTLGGGTRTQELTLPGFRHDVCSSVHPLTAASPFFRGLRLQDWGLEWIHPDAPLAHPFDDGSAAVLYRSTADTAETLGRDALPYRRLMDPLLAGWQGLVADILGPAPIPPRHPFTLARFTFPALRSGQGLARSVFHTPRGRAFFLGLAAHSIQSLDNPATAAFGIVTGLLGHAVGWPFARGGAERITQVMARYLRHAGGQIETGRRVEALDELPPSGVVLLDVTPRQLTRIARRRLPLGYRRRLNRFRYGPGVFKVDWALREPIPWTAPECRLAGTVHVGGPPDEILASEWAAFHGQLSLKPFIILAQTSLWDDTRAPAGRHTAWAYCHVPNGCNADMTAAIEAQIERFAPGFRDVILARHTMTPAEMEAHNANYIGGDINGGVQDLFQLFTRPVSLFAPYATPNPRIFLCSSSTPPGGGVHGMCGYHAARLALPRARAPRP